MKSFARKLRALADELYRTAGTEREADELHRMGRYRFLTGVASELHRLAHLLENWSDS
jgi:hypothetical protein